MRLHNIASFAILVALLIPCAVYGVDGVILIDQNKALAGNVTPGDTPGFPVTISQPGSYRLDSNLTVPNVNTTAIVIAADNVSIDLNGFSILGPNVCGQAAVGGFTIFDCVPGGTGVPSEGYGILADVHENITIRNGTIQGMGYTGININGGLSLVERMHVSSNGGNGILVFGGIVQDSTVRLNQFVGLSIVFGTVRNNLVQQNFGGGIDVDDHGLVVQNVSINNGFGLSISRGSSYLGNIFDNVGSNVSGTGVNLGQNLCRDVLCP